jgi:YVTN family beta-propeller protein
VSGRRGRAAASGSYFASNLIGRDPMGLAFAGAGKTAVVANHGDGSISVIDLETMKVTGNYPAGKGIETLTRY